MSERTNGRSGPVSPQRRSGAALANLLGQGSRQARRQDYASLAEALADNLPKPLAEDLAAALGIEHSAYVESDSQETEVDTAPETEPDDGMRDLGERFGLLTGYVEPNHAEAETKPKQEQEHVEPDPALRLRTSEDWLRERDARIKQKRLKKFVWTRDPLHHEALILPNYSGTVIPNMIARAQLYDAVMLYGDKAFKKRFDRAFGLGAADAVLSGRR